MLGGNGGNGNGGTAQLLATGFAVGPTDIRINSTANDGDGGFGNFGDRGDCGHAHGCTDRAQPPGSGQKNRAPQSNFVTPAGGGSGITEGTAPRAPPDKSPIKTTTQ